MFTTIKKTLLLTAILLFPGVAFSYVSIIDAAVDNDVPIGSKGFVVSIHAKVDAGDTWESTYFDWDGAPPDKIPTTYTNICLDHQDFGPGEYWQVFYVPFDGETADPSDWFDVEPHENDSCTDFVGYPIDENVYMSTDKFSFNDVTNFGVVKMFYPVLEGQEVNVHISCSAGFPGDDDASLIGNQGIQVFPQIGIDPANQDHECVITETTQVPGYRPFYWTNEGVVSTEGCFFYGSGNMTSENMCYIINEGLPSTFTVTKEWEVFQDSDAAFVTTEELRIMIGALCSDEFLSVHVVDEGECKDDGDDTNGKDDGCFFDFTEDKVPEISMGEVIGDATVTWTVENNEENPLECIAFEQVMYSNVEMTESTCNLSSIPIDQVGRHPQGPPPKVFEFAPGGSQSCGFVNTVFFEGIPTLSQYGMALMALLMLGVGFVGFRRFV